MLCLHLLLTCLFVCLFVGWFVCLFIIHFRANDKRTYAALSPNANKISLFVCLFVCLVVSAQRNMQAKSPKQPNKETKQQKQPKTTCTATTNQTNKLTNKLTKTTKTTNQTKKGSVKMPAHFGVLPENFALKARSWFSCFWLGGCFFNACAYLC